MLSAIDWVANDRTLKGASMRADAISSAIWGDKKWRDPYSVVSQEFKNPASGTTMNGTTINIITSQPISQVLDEIGNAVGGGPDAQPFTRGIVS